MNPEAAEEHLLPRDDQLAVLRRLRREGQISDEEYRNLAGGFREPALDTADAPTPDAPVVEDAPIATVPPAVRRYESKSEPDDSGPQPVDSDTDQPGEQSEADDGSEPDPAKEPERGSVFRPPQLRSNLSSSYLLSLAAAVIVLLLVSGMGMLSWWVTFATILVLLSTLIEGWGRVTAGAAVVASMIIVVGVVSSLGGSPEPEPVVAVTLPPEEPDPAIPGSLGIYMDQVTELWNTVDAPPRISRGLTRHNEVGEYDTFIYRFGDWGSVAGAFDPESEAVYALLATGSFSEPATEQLYVHLCFMVAPYSAECIDSYHEEGLAGGGLTDFTDATREAEWEVGESIWRLEIGQNLLAIRVYGPDAA